MDECLLSRSLLQSMGFNLTDHLKRFHHMIDGKHVDELDPSTIKAAALKYSGLSYDDADDDPIRLSEGLSAGIGIDGSDSIDKAFSSTVSNVEESGISISGSNRMKHLLEKYRNVFRIKLGPDPPTKVAPLVISCPEKAKPFRSHQLVVLRVNANSLSKPSASSKRLVPSTRTIHRDGRVMLSLFPNLVQPNKVHCRS